MSSDDIFNGFDHLDSSVVANATDVLHFLNGLDNEHELTDLSKALNCSITKKTSKD